MKLPCSTFGLISITHCCHFPFPFHRIVPPQQVAAFTSDSFLRSPAKTDINLHKTVYVLARDTFVHIEPSKHLLRVYFSSTAKPSSVNILLRPKQTVFVSHMISNFRKKGFWSVLDISQKGNVCLSLLRLFIINCSIHGNSLTFFHFFFRLPIFSRVQDSIA